MGAAQSAAAAAVKEAAVKEAVAAWTCWKLAASWPAAKPLGALHAAVCAVHAAAGGNSSSSSQVPMLRILHRQGQACIRPHSKECMLHSQACILLRSTASILHSQAW